MKKLKFGSVLLALALAANVSFGGDLKETAAAEKRVKELEKVIEDQGIYVETAKKGIVLSGYVDASYSYNFNGGGTDSGINGTPGSIRTHEFDVDSNDFNVNQVKIALEKALPEENTWAAGFRIDLMYGEDVKYIADASGEGGEDFMDNLEQAYVQFRIPVGNGLDVKFGKFVSLLGYEVIETPANLNVSRSYWFTYGIPRHHTGFVASYKFNDVVDVKLGLVNGWNNADSNYLDGNDIAEYVDVGDGHVTPIQINGENGDDGPSDFAKAITAQIAIHAPGGNADLVNSFIYSFEGEAAMAPAAVNGANLSSRNNMFHAVDPTTGVDGAYWDNLMELENEGVFVWDIWGQWKPKAFNDKLLLAFDGGVGHCFGTGSLYSWDHANHGNEVTGVGEGDNTSTWWGIALYAKYQFTKIFSLAGRAEYLHEDDSVARGLYDSVVRSTDGDYDSVDYSDAAMYHSNTDAWSWTLTAGFDIWENLLARLEYRLDAISSDGGAGAEAMDNANDLDDLNAFTNNQSTQHTLILDFSYSF